MPKQGIGPSDKMLEQTVLSPKDERQYKNWTKHYKLKDIDPKTGEPWDDVKYDMRGYWQENKGPNRMAGHGPIQIEGAHGPDTYKQHGHPTFSTESKYSRGKWDGGTWIPGSEVLMPPPFASHKRQK